MSYSSETGKISRGYQEFLSGIRTRAIVAQEQLAQWLPALNLKNTGRGIIAGLIGLTSIACSPKSEPTPAPQAPIVRVEPTPAAGSPRPPEPPITQKEVVQKKPGIYVKTLTLEQTDAPLRNHLIYAQLPVTKVIDIEAVDFQNNTAGFGFIESADNKPRVVFRTPDNNAVSFLYTSAATVDPKDQKVNVEYLTTHDKSTFLRLVLNKNIPKQANETDEQYKERVIKLLKDPSYQQEIQDALGKPEQIEQVIVANPFAKTQVVFDTKKEPNFLDQLLAAFSPKTAYAATLPPPQPTATPKPEAPKPLPEVISNKTAEFVSPPAEEVQKMVEETKAKGELKIPLPDIIKNDGISVVEITHKKTGNKVLAITGNKEGVYTLPALSDGKVIEVGVSKTASFDSLAIMGDNGSWGYAFPSPSTSPLKEGDIVKAGQPVVTFTYQLPLKYGFDRFLGAYQDAPKNTMALIVLGNSAGKGINTSKENVLQTLQGKLVIVTSP